jgi:hypothetical protein
MNKLIRLLLLGISCITAGSLIYGQCEPDTIGCIDIDEPGQFCPRNLPDAVIGEPYEAIVTVITPGSVVMSPYPPLTVFYLTVDTVLNIPAGLTYEANADIFYANKAYCILISGTPTTAGVDTLAITVTAYVDLLGTGDPIPFQVTDDTSIIVRVLETAGMDPAQAHRFHVLPNIPNPFSDVTRIGIYSPFDEKIEFAVYNILGELLHEEKLGFPPGEHYFDFDGRSIQPGTYFYRISNTKEVFTGKLVKARM